MATVEILFRAVDNASAVINKVTASVDKSVKTGFNKAADSLDRYGKSINGAVQSLTGMNLAQVGIAAVVGTTINQVRKSVDAWSTYVEQVDKGVQKTGMAAEEYSRLVQVADDFRVSMSEIESAMGMALKNGFNPTTENLAILADEINAISDPTERAAKLTDIFGRQWENVIPLLSRGGDAIREAAAGISDGLIVTDESIETNREYQAAVDNLGDAFSAMSNTMAREALPAITAVTEALANAATASANNQGTLAGVTGGYGRAAYAMQKAQRAMLYNADGARYTALAQAYLAENTDKLTGTIVNDNTELRYMKGHLDDAAAATKNLNDKMEKLREQQYTDLRVEVTGNFGNEIDSYNTKLQDLQIEHGDLVTQIDELEGQEYLTQDQRSNLDAMRDKLGENNLAIQNLKNEHASAMKEMAFNMLMERAASDGMTENEVKNLTNIATQWGLLDPKTKEIVDAINENMDELNTENPQRILDTISGIMGLPETKTFTIDVYYNSHGSFSLDPSAGDVGLGGDAPVTYEDTDTGEVFDGKFASGISDFIVPSRYNEQAGRPFVAALDGGEHVTVTPAGQTRGGSVINISNVNLPVVTNAQQFVRELGKIASLGYQAGIYSAGG